MKLNINSPLKRNDIREVLEANECPKFTYIKNILPMEMQFEVVDDEKGSHGDLERYTSHLIKKQPWGGALLFRVKEDGKFL